MPNRILLCPLCKAPMVRRLLRELGPTVEVDRCPQGCGMWLDNGEYESLRDDRLKRVKGEKP